LALLFAVLFLPSMLAQGGGMNMDAFDNPAYHLQLLIVAVPQILLILYILELQPELDATRFGLVRLSPSTLPHALLIGLGAALLLGGLSLIASVALPEALREALFGGLEWRFTRLELLPLLLLSTLVIGYREELFFRAYLIARFEELGLSRPLVVAASSLLFAAGHLYQGVGAAILAAVMGVYFALAFFRRRNLHAIAIGHALYNAGVLVLSSLRA
jgi:hypothetical protein